MPPVSNLRSSQDSRKKPRASPNTFGRINTISGIAVGSNSISHDLTAGDLEQIGSVACLRQWQGQLFQLRGIDVAGAKCDLLRATPLQALAALDRIDEHRSLHQG